MNSSSPILDKETMTVPFLLVKIELLIRHISNYADVLVDEIIKANPITATTSDAKKDIATRLREKARDKGYLFIKKLNRLNTDELMKENISDLMTGWAKNFKNNSNSKRVFYGKPNPLVRIDLIEQDNSNIHLGFEDYPREIGAEFINITNLAINLSKMRDWLLHFAKRIENETDILLTEVYNQIDLENNSFPKPVQEFFGEVTDFCNHFLNDFRFELSKFPTVNFDSFESFDEECLELQKWSESCVSVLEKEVNLIVDEKLKKLKEDKNSILGSNSNSKPTESKQEIKGRETISATSSSNESGKEAATKSDSTEDKKKTIKAEKNPTSAETVSQNKLKYKLGISPENQYEEKIPKKSGPNFFQRNKKEFAVGAVVVTALIAVNAIPIIGQIASAVGWIIFGAVLLGSGLLGGATTAAVCDVQVEKPVIKRTQSAPIVMRCAATPTTQNQNVKRVPIRKESSDYGCLFRSRSATSVSNPAHHSSYHRLV